VALDVTTQSAGACTVSIGGAANGTTLKCHPHLRPVGRGDGHLHEGHAPGAEDRRRHLDHVSTASGASSGLVGQVYVEFFPA
jgi:hypothetical protein